jgi:hypothetical protein
MGRVNGPQNPSTAPEEAAPAPFPLCLTSRPAEAGSTAGRTKRPEVERGVKKVRS